jgi:hypothetical protein
MRDSSRDRRFFLEANLLLSISCEKICTTFSIICYYVVEFWRCETESFAVHTILTLYSQENARPPSTEFTYPQHL